MTAKDNFQRAWKSRFSNKKPPELGCFEMGDLDSKLVEREFKRCKDRIKDLKAELNEEEFISDFLGGIVRDFEQPKPVQSLLDRVEMGPDLDSPIPVWDEQHGSRGGSTGPRDYRSGVAPYMETNLDFLIAAGQENAKAHAPQTFEQSPAHDNRLTQSTEHVEPNANVKAELGAELIESGSSNGVTHVKANTSSNTVHHSITHGKVSHDKNTQPSHSTTSVAHSHHEADSVTAKRAALTRKLSQDSHPGHLQNQKKQLQDQRMSYTVELQSDRPKGGQTQAADQLSSTAPFSTFKPPTRAATLPKRGPGHTSGMSEAKFKPIPAPRPSVMGPNGKIQHSSSFGPCNLDAIPSSPEANHGHVTFPTSTRAESPTNRNNISDSPSNRTGSPAQNHTGSPKTRKDKHGPVPPGKPASIKRKQKNDYMNVDMDTIQRNYLSSQNMDNSTEVNLAKDCPQSSASVSKSGSSDNLEEAGNRATLDSPVPLAKFFPKNQDHAKEEVIYDEPIIVKKPSEPCAVNNAESLIYDEALPVKEDKVESCSSSDEEAEPIYYNLLLLKKQTMKRASREAHSFYGSVDMHRSPPDPHAKPLPTSLSLDLTKKIGPRQAANLPPGADLLNLVSAAKDGDNSSQAWKNRRSMLFAMGGSGDIPEEPEVIDTLMPSHAAAEPDEGLQMRKWVIKSILESERAYVGVLDILVQYMQTFKNISKTPQSVITEEEISIIFFKVQELHRIHYHFIRNLEPKLDNWSSNQEVAEIFKILALEEYPLASEYLKNYPQAVAKIKHCAQENPMFAELTKDISCKDINETPSLEELVHKPVARFQRNTLVLNDLIKCTPTSHPDYDLLQKTRNIAKNFLENFQSPVEHTDADSQRYLCRQGLLVEKIGNSKNRKVRHIFLFNDVLVCAKQKMSGRQRISNEVKWFIPLFDLQTDDKVTPEEQRQLADYKKQEVGELQRKVSDLQNELKVESKRAKMAEETQRNWSFRGHTNKIDRVRKKLSEEEGKLMLASPNLVFRMCNRSTKKSHTLLMASDYERTNWKDSISGLQNRVSGTPVSPGGTTVQSPVPVTFSTVELQNLINSQKMPKMNRDTHIERDDVSDYQEDYVFGLLDVTIHKLNGLKTPSDTFCCIEIDSFGLFFIKAKTSIMKGLKEPAWNENFDIDLDGAQTLRILCYTQSAEGNVLLGKCALELGTAWLKGDFNQENIPLSAQEMSLTLTLKYRSREQTLKRTPSSAQGAIFGARIGAVTKREGTNIPSIVRICVEEIEQRGLDDVGLYRISGLSAEIQRLKKTFEKSTKAAIAYSRDCDINVLTGLLKLYFRELPEALFTDHLYPALVDSMSLSEPEARQKCMQSLLKRLPEPNLSTVHFILDHLIRVSKHEIENKMSPQNLATVFGPTLLRPATRATESQSMAELFSMGAQEAMMQTAILLYYLTLHAREGSSTRL